MPAIQDLKQEVTDLVTMKYVAQAFTEASAAKLQNIRAAFEKNKQFYDEISHLYHVIRLSETLTQQNQTQQTAPPKTVAVAVTSNQRFYGNININIMHGFMDDVETDPAIDLIVIGATGQDYLRSIGFPRAYEKVTLEKEYPSKEEARMFLEKVKPYKTVFLFYPKFVTLVTQQVSKIDITQAAAPKGDTTTKEEAYILYEPEFGKVMAFFETQVRSLLFLRVMLESDLSRTAARLLSMSAAEERSDDLIKEKKAQLRKVITSFINAQLLETFSGMTKWHK